MMKRLIFDLVLLATVLYLPWWVVTPVAFTGAVFFTSFYEIFIFGMLIDLLYGTSMAALHGLMGLICSIVVYAVAIQAKKFVRPSY